MIPPGSTRAREPSPRRNCTKDFATGVSAASVVGSMNIYLAR